MLVYQNFVREDSKDSQFEQHFFTFQFKNFVFLLVFCTLKHNEINNAKILHTFDIGMKVFSPVLNAECNSG
jgi:hypothetical protein